MKTGIRTDLIQSQKLQMTQQLRQSIEMLQLNTLELYQRIETEVMENPMLEMIELPEAPKTKLEPKETSEEKKDLGWENSFNNNQSEEYQPSGQGSPDSGDRLRSFLEGAVYQEKNFRDLLEEQAHVEFSKEQDLGLAMVLITALNEKGFFDRDPAEIAQAAGFQDSDQRERILRAIQEFDPIGLATSGVLDSLEVQARILYPGEKLLPDLLRYFYTSKDEWDSAKVAALWNLSEDQVGELFHKLSSLSPFPAAQYGSEGIRYILPDLFIYSMDGEIIVELNDQWLPKVSINREYQNLLRDKSGDLKKEDKNYLSQKLTAAQWLIRGVEQRRRTLLAVTKAIVEKQREFFLRGPSALKPLSLQDVAEMVSLHKSSVSRTVNGKYVETSWGVFELKSFFARSLLSESGEETATLQVKQWIQELVKAETKSLSDQEIAEKLRQKGLELARRTVAKYREELGIPTSSKRRQQK